MSPELLEKFLLKARSRTYVAADGRRNPLLPGSVQYEYREKDHLYRDIYYIGNGIFSGMEVVHDKDRPIWSMSYFGDFSKMSEEQADTMLREALVDLWDQTRVYKDVRRDHGRFMYRCNGKGSMQKLSGIEEISVQGNLVYSFTYNGGSIG